jgi:hypothetical protein
MTCFIAVIRNRTCNIFEVIESENACLYYSPLIGGKVEGDISTSEFSFFTYVHETSPTAPVTSYSFDDTVNEPYLPSYFINRFRPRIPGIGIVNIPISIKLW